MRIGPERYEQPTERAHVRPDGLHRPAVKGLEAALALAKGYPFLEIGSTAALAVSNSTVQFAE